MDLIYTKILVAILFGVVRFTFGLLPIKLYKILLLWEKEPLNNEDTKSTFINEKRHNQVRCGLALCQSFGGGVLFATCFLHMMPEVYESVEDLKRFGGLLKTNYPISQLMISFGFFLIYFVEETSHWFITRIPEQCANANNSAGSNKIAPAAAPPTPQLTITEILETPIIIDEKVMDSSPSKEKQQEEEEQRIEEEIKAALAVESTAKDKQHIVRCVLIVLALSLHAIFEGLAIGLQTRSITNIWYLFVAISIHSATILFCFGLELLLAQVRHCTIVWYVFCLAITSPFGVLLGLLITIEANLDTRAKSAAIVLLEGLSAGTILYIIFFEVLNREKTERRTWRLRRALCIIMGFALMAVLQSVEIY